MFLIGALPVVLLPYIWFKVPESPVWLAARARKENTALLPVLRKQWKLCLYLVLVMAFFNFFSHGTQDLYPTFLKMQHGFDPHLISIIAIFYNIAAMLGGIFYGTLSERIGRKSDHDRRLSCASGTPAMGIFQRIIHDWSGRVPDAVYGAGRLGCRADLAERAGSGECARRAARVCLPTR